MKILLPILALFLHGCLYFNDKGISTHLYDNCREYYDECGIYRKECPPNIVEYGKIKTCLEPCERKDNHEHRCYPQ